MKCGKKLEVKSIYGSELNFQKRTAKEQICVYLTGIIGNDRFLPRDEVIKVRDWLNQFIDETEERYRYIFSSHNKTFLSNSFCHCAYDDKKQIAVAWFIEEGECKEYIKMLNKGCKG